MTVTWFHLVTPGYWLTAIWPPMSLSTHKSCWMLPIKWPPFAVYWRLLKLTARFIWLICISRKTSGLRHKLVRITWTNNDQLVLLGNITGILSKILVYPVNFELEIQRIIIIQIYSNFLNIGEVSKITCDF